MTGKDLFIGLGYIDTRYFAEAETDGLSEKLTQPRKKPLRRPFLIAAIVALMLLLVGCAVGYAVVYVLSVKDLYLGQVNRIQYELDENRQPVFQTEVVLDVISAQGMLGSPNFLAAREWLEFEESYQLDLETAESFPVPQGYEAYSAFSQEMVDKVDEICRKYDLKIMGTRAHMQIYQFDILHEALGVDSLFRSGAEVNHGVGWFSQCGNFDVTVIFSLTSEEASWKRPIYANIHYADKNYFDPLVYSVGDAETVKQRNYTLEDGTQVLIVGEGKEAILLYGREDAFLSVYFEPNTTGGKELVLTDRDLELVAEAVDFTIKPHKPNMAYAQRLLDQAEAANREESASYMPESYGELLKGITGELYYALADLNEDGVEELLFGRSQNSFEGFWTMVDGHVQPLVNDIYFLGDSATQMYLCEDGIWEVSQTEADGSFVQAYYRLEKDILKDGVSELAYVRYNAQQDAWHSCPTQTAYDRITDTWNPVENEFDLLTEEQAREIMASYSRIELELKPISEFPSN